MKFALVNEIKTEPHPTLKGKCPACGAEMIPKCGDIKVHHWAHNRGRICDPWWENETSWHRDWKNQFPVDWQEVPCKDENGVIHIADVKRPDGFYIEFQNSPISKDEVESRNQYYKNLVWVLNGCRSSVDQEKMSSAKGFVNGEGIFDITKLKLRIVHNWKNLAKNIFIDFNDSNLNGFRRIFYLFNDEKRQFLRGILVDDFISKAKIRGGLRLFIEDTLKLKEEFLEREKSEEEKKIRERREWEEKYVDPFVKKYPIKL